MITVGQLKKMLETVHDDTILVVEGHDHSYRRAEVHVTTAVNEEPSKRHGHLSEDFGLELNEGAKRVAVLLVV